MPRFKMDHPIFDQGVCAAVRLGSSETEIQLSKKLQRPVGGEVEVVNLEEQAQDLVGCPRFMTCELYLEIL